MRRIFRLAPRALDEDGALKLLHSPTHGGRNPYKPVDEEFERLHQLRLHSSKPQPLKGVVATVFGGTGFVGNHVVRALALKGARVICPWRNNSGNKWAPQTLRRAYRSGSTVPICWDPTSFADYVKLVERSSLVINCIGCTRTPGFMAGDLNFGYEAVYANMPRWIARACAMRSVDRFIHVSHVNADPEHWALGLKCKGLGEQYVKEEFPDTTVARFADAFGMMDTTFISWVDAMHFTYVQFPNLYKRVQPLYVGDMARAIARLGTYAEHQGKTWELGGPKVYYLCDLLNQIQSWFSTPGTAFHGDTYYRTVRDPSHFWWHNRKSLWYWETFRKNPQGLSPWMLDELHHDTVVHPGSRGWKELEVDESDLVDAQIMREYLILSKPYNPQKSCQVEDNYQVGER